MSVADNGAGVDGEAVAELFDPFFTTKHFGMGMGLSISRGIIESHGGAICYRPNAPLGSIFEFELPLMRATATAPANCRTRAFSSEVGTGSREEPKVRAANTRQNKNLERRSDSIGSGL